MKYRVITLMLGVSLAVASVSGCGRSPEPEKPVTEAQTEQQSIEVMDVEVVSGAENAGQTETASKDESSYQTEKTAQVSPAADEGMLSAGQGAEDEAETSMQENTPSVGRIWQGITTLNEEKDSETEEEVFIIEEEAGAAGTAESVTEAGTAAITEPETDQRSEAESEAETGDAVRTAVRSAEAWREAEETENSAPKEDDGSDGGNLEDTLIEVVNEDGTVTEFENETEAGPVSETAEDSENESEFGTAEELESEAGPEAEEEPESEAGPEAEEEPESETEPETMNEPESAAAEQEMSEEESGNDLTVEPGNEAEAVGVEGEPESETEPETKEEPAGESESETGSETMEEPESAASEQEMSEDESGSDLTVEPGNEAEAAGAEEEPESETEPETEEEPGSEAGIETKEESESETESESEAESETESETEEISFQLGTPIDRVNVRTGASTDTESKALLKPGNKVIILESGDDGWSLVKYEAETGIEAGYVKTEYLVSAEQLRIAAENVNVRSEPNSDSEDNKLGKFEGGEEIPVLGEEDGGWSKIAFEKDGAVETAYVKSEFLSEYNYLDSDSAIVVEYKNMLAGEGQDVDELMAGLAAEAEASAAETAAETEAAVTGNGLPPWPKDPVEAQFKLAQWLVPDLGTVGVIYTRGNQETRELVGVYKDTAEKYNMELVEATVTSLEDIDFAAAELVGEVYGILIIDDEIVDSAVNVVTAYADEVGIPVIGSSEEQVKNGCAAAVDNGTVYFSQGELDKLGISLNLDQ